MGGIIGSESSHHATKCIIFAVKTAKIGEIYEKVNVFSDGLADVGGLFERSFDGTQAGVVGV